MGTQLPFFKKGQSPHQFSARVYCAQTAGWIKMPLGMEVKPRPRPHCARWGPSSPPQKGAQPPIFSPCLLCPNGWVDQDALDMEVGLGTVHIVLDVNLLAFPENGAQPQFSARVCCGQTAGWIKMALCTKVGLVSGHIVLHGDPAPPPIRGTAPKIFGPCLLWPNGRPSQLLLSTCPLAYEKCTQF